MILHIEDDNRLVFLATVGI